MSCLIVLFKIDETFKICFYSTILPLILVINVKIKREKKLLFDTKQVTEQ